MIRCLQKLLRTMRLQSRFRLSGGSNKKAESIYSMAFDNAKAMMNIIAEEYEVSFEDVLSTVRDVAKL